MTRRDELTAEVLAVLEDYIKAFETGGREEVQAFVHLPVIYIAEDDVQVRERYPFDPVKLRAATGLHRAEMDHDVVHIDESKAHVLIKGRRKRADGSDIEGLESVYILQKRDGEWKIAAFSGIRTPVES
ncbi:MAG: hypothetical protein QF578_13510 [Alphaproteobacteria bacterium]|jgi:hypothetical protein|nr:hypothetical protein [Alphaproteobacteria bacterium]